MSKEDPGRNPYGKNLMSRQPKEEPKFPWKTLVGALVIMAIVVAASMLRYWP